MKESINKKLYNNTTVELKEVKVELGLAEEIKTSISDASQVLSKLNDQLNLMNEANAMLKKASENADKLEMSGRKITDSASKANMKRANILDKVDKQAKDLGVDSKQVSGYNELNKTYQDIEAVLQKLVGFTWFG